MFADAGLLNTGCVAAFEGKHFVVGPNDVYVHNDKDKYDVLMDLYDTLNITQSIIYVNSKKTLRYLYEKLVEQKFPVSHIHGEMDSKDRSDNMNNFKSGVFNGEPHADVDRPHHEATADVRRRRGLGRRCTTLTTIIFHQ